MRSRLPLRGEGPSHAGFRQEVNRLCRENRANLRLITARELVPRLREVPEAQRPTVLADFLRRETPVEQRFFDRLGRVRAPSDIDRDWRDFVARERAGLPIISRTADLMESGDRAGIARLRADVVRLAKPLNAFLDREALEDCKRGSRPGGLE